MSEIESLVGKLIPVEINGDIENTCRLILEDAGQEKSEYYDTYKEKLEDWGYKKYHITETAIYSVEMVNKDPDEDIFHAVKNDDGSYDFTLKYYNGGCSFEEAIEEALDKINAC